MLDRVTDCDTSLWPWQQHADILVMFAFIVYCWILMPATAGCLHVGGTVPVH